MTERDLGEIRVLRAEAAVVRELMRVEREPRCMAALCEHLERVEAKRFALMAWILEIPDARVRCICVMRFVEGKSWETVARRLHYERTGPAKMMRRVLARHADGCYSTW